MTAIASEKSPREATVQVQEGVRIIVGDAFDAVPTLSQATIQYQKGADNTINLSIL